MLLKKNHTILNPIDKSIKIKDAFLNFSDLEEHAKEIAKLHTVDYSIEASSKVLQERLDYNYKKVARAYQEINQYAKKRKELVPASDWLLDNFYKIEEQVKEVKQSLKRERFLKLKLLTSGVFKGFPRIYIVALEYVFHSDGRIDVASLEKFIRAYQSQNVLTISEIWSLSLMLRVALVENIRSICERVLEAEKQWRKAEAFLQGNNEEILVKLKDNFKIRQRLETSFLQHLLRQCRKEGIDTGNLVSYLEDKLIEFNTNVENIIEEEHRQQALRKISLGNSITSLNVVATLDWNDIFEALSVVEGILLQDPAGIYGAMDFESRDYYRRIIERLSRAYSLKETTVAKAAIEASAKAPEGGLIKDKHIGYYLLDKGRRELLMGLEVDYKKDPLSNKGVSNYLAPMLLSVILATGLIMLYSYSHSSDVFMTFSVGLVALVPISEIVLLFVNRIFVGVRPPTLIPRLELKEGVPAEAFSIVIVPTLLSKVERVQEILKQLEVHYYSNKEKNIRFALVGDFKDAETETLPEDQSIIDTALRGVKALNNKYKDGEDIFYYFHRKRQFNERDNRWMGWERKRGAISEFNSLILNSKQTSYYIVSGDVSKLREVKYVVTLDADTLLPLGTARTLIGMMAHPLNMPIIDKEKNIVTEGYGLIQPRVGVNIESKYRSFFTKVFSGPSGFDVYTSASSDIYQDIFGEGSFTGKGIYNLEVFEKILAETIPDNRILSHDLLEGSFLRTGLASDVEVIDAYPAKFSSYILRLHRWVRGDWQLLPWLSSTIELRYGKAIQNPLSVLTKWKIIDNLRRSLVPVGLFLLVFLGLVLFPGQGLVWIGLAAAVVFTPFALGLYDYCKSALGNMAEGKAKSSPQLEETFHQGLLILVFLPYKAFMMVDAIIRSIYRVYISKSRMLEWVTVADTEVGLRNDLTSSFKRLKVNLIAVVALFIAAFLFQSERILLVVIFALIWSVGPRIEFKINIESTEEDHQLNPQDLRLIRRNARKTWSYFEDFANEENNYLPPDNFQEFPPNGVAHRTSPTNIGLLLATTLAARDLGYITTSQMVDRVEKTIGTIENLETWKGHLYNWYDTRSLKVLRPQYISSVDSGNYISYLVTVVEGLKDFLEKKPLLDIKLIQGIRDTLLLYEANEDMNFFEIVDPISNRDMLSYDDLSKMIDSLLQLQSVERHEKLFSLISAIRQETEELLMKAGEVKHFDKEHNLYDYSLLKLRDFYEDILTNNRFNQKLKGQEEGLRRNLENTKGIIDKLYSLIDRINVIINATEFKYLYSEKRNLFSIGYNVEEEKLTNSYYDLLASEARTTSYWAIAKGEIPKKHWLKLGRTISQINGSRGLVSWTGTMFEYFMAPLLLKTLNNSLMEETLKTVVEAQINYGEKRQVPWGVSESGYYTFDLALNYQYRAFGIPDLGLKRGLIEDTVISPYSTMLALPFAPKKAMVNLKRLMAEELEGDYGFYEAVDYTQRGISTGENKKIVRSFMAHHLGMSLLAIDNLLNDKIMVKRFHSNPIIKAAETLLHEKIPTNAIVTKEFKEVLEPVEDREIYQEKAIRSFGVPQEIPPNCQILSNGRLSLMLTEAGEGYSRLENLQVTRWREDLVTSSYGTFIFVNCINKNKLWSSTYHPKISEPDGYKSTFSMDRAEFIRTDEDMVTHSEIVISSEDNVEIRRLKLTNHGTETAVIELTSYLEPVLVPQAADIAHPAFSNLFVRTEFLKEYGALLASRRPREHGQGTKWIFHSLVVDGETTGGLQYETNRGNFIGRGRGLSNAVGLTQPLTNTTGVAIDPIMSIRRKLSIKSGGTVFVSYMTGVSDDREEAIELARKYQDPPSIERAYQLAYTRSQVELNYLNLKAYEVILFQSLLGHLLYLSPLKKKYSRYMSANNKGQSGLWPFGISGDLPIVLVSLKASEEIDIVRQALKAHEYWRIKGLKVDLVILNEDESSYLQPLKSLLKDIVAFSHGRHIQDQPGGIFIRDIHNMTEEDKILFYSTARIVLKGNEGSLKEQMGILPEEKKSIPLLKPSSEGFKSNCRNENIDVDFSNDYGGFSKDGREYIIMLREDLQTPAPWVNVVSNEGFGFVVSENGSSYTWSENSRENKLTPWNNDPVSDVGHEIFYIRDDDSGEIWTITPLPIREKEGYTIRHGIGYSVIQHNSHGIEQQLTMFVPTDEAVKLNIVKLKNDTNTKRRLSIYYYIRPVMGVSDQHTQQYIITEYNQEMASILIRNPFNTDFPGQFTFMGTAAEVASYTGNRQEFIGLLGSLAAPEAIRYEVLSREVGAGFDPCGVLHTRLELNIGEEREMSFIFGQTYDVNKVGELVKGYKSPQQCSLALERVKGAWLNRLEKIQVKTPDKSMDLMLNSWLLYQTMSCRLWSRSAFYQSGGAYGYRDQLQDAMNILHVYPEAARRQILIHCQHQFVEGDVQHWWHPGAGEKGIRTKFSDDLLWLPFVTVEYLQQTNDYQLLREVRHFLEDEPLDDKTDERYGIPRISEEASTVYDHCIRAIERSLRFGIHDIPLMGSGDWNDGMSTVGNKGKGESVWLGWFIYYILVRFADICIYMKEPERADRYRDIADKIVAAIEKNAWDGEWYIRAFYDDGSPLGSSKNTECIIDSLAQSWSIISGAGDLERSKIAMRSVENYLIRREEGLILLFTPPFDNSDQNPGYIKGYVPGVRENGGQYSHAAAWVINAFARMGEGKKAWELFHMINPINHTRTQLECAIYKVEPYVMAADVYAVSPHVGRGGWSWYTGASGWMYRVGIEEILGLRKKGSKLYFTPSIPPDWGQYEINYKHENTTYSITIKNPEGVSGGVSAVYLDGVLQSDKEVTLMADGVDHQVEVVLGKEQSH